MMAVVASLGVIALFWAMFVAIMIVFGDSRDDDDRNWLA